MECFTLKPRSLWLACALVFIAVFSQVSFGKQSPISCDLQGKIEERLSCIEGLKFERNIKVDAPKGYSVYDLRFVQPVDHDEPNGENFEQHLVLFHVSDSGPMVLQTSGYQIFSKALTLVAKSFNANQIQVEHRYFGDSVPKSKDWTKLDIRQSANDFHRISTHFKKIYPMRWLNTGASKGGMTSVYHRYFFPDDVDGTLALVAPLSYSTSDERYVDFVGLVGGDLYKTCRDKLEVFQKALLKSKKQILPRITGSFSKLGSKEIAFEHAVIEAPFAFWQYGSPSSTSTGCARVPKEGASVADLLSFLNQVNNVTSSYSDSGLDKFVPYYVQAAHQLGGPGSKLEHLEGVASHLETYDLSTYVPDQAQQSYDASVMPEVQQWVLEQSKSMMFIYGEYDPWTAGAFKHNEDGDSFFYVAPAGNHGANVNTLSAKDRTKAWAHLGRWLDRKKPDLHHRVSVAAREPTAEKPQVSLEDIEFKARRYFRR